MSTANRLGVDNPNAEHREAVEPTQISEGGVNFPVRTRAGIFPEKNRRHTQHAAQREDLRCNNSSNMRGGGVLCRSNIAKLQYWISREKQHPSHYVSIV